MALINHIKKEINTKIVYYGPGLGGKTTNVKFIYEKMKPEYRGKFKVLNTPSGKMYFFDFMRPEQIGIQDYNIRFHIYTIPGEIADFAIWKTVLKGLDGLVFVADSDPGRLPDNLEAMGHLNAYLAELGLALKEIPFIVQCNKQDLVEVTTPEEIRKALNVHDCPVIAASAGKGEGVLNTLSTIVKVILQKLRDTSLDAADQVVERTAESMAEPLHVQETAEEEIEHEPLSFAETAEVVAEYAEEEAPPEEFSDFAAPETPLMVGGLETVMETTAEAGTEDVLESEGISAEIDYTREINQSEPGHLRLPVTIRHGGETKKIYLNVSISLEEMEN